MFKGTESPDQDTVPPNVVSFSSAISASTKARQWDQALWLLSEMRCTRDAEPDEHWCCIMYIARFICIRNRLWYKYHYVNIYCKCNACHALAFVYHHIILDIFRYHVIVCLTDLCSPCIHLSHGQGWGGATQRGSLLCGPCSLRQSWTMAMDIEPMDGDEEDRCHLCPAPLVAFKDEFSLSL